MAHRLPSEAQVWEQIEDSILNFFANLFSGQQPGWMPRGRAMVPDVRGLTVDEARLTLGREGLRPELHPLQDEPAPVMGTVVDQNPEPGTRHRRAEPVIVYVQHLLDSSLPE
jgi:beta-lactam-binding protein with PASTA domain